MTIGIGVGSLLLFLFFQATGIYGGDSGDLVTAAVTFGVPHPPGYPLYTLLGWLASLLPIATPAWRVGLLSSLAHALTVGLVSLFVWRLTRGNIIAAIVAPMILVSNYLFFLYSTTPEVFALFDLFVILLAYLIYMWSETKNARFLWAACFVFGLSLTHHHVILFFVPAMGYLFYNSYKNYKSYIFGFVFFLGLLPYLYIPIAARGSAIVNWDRAVDWTGFVRLLTRQDYGTFVASGFYGALPIHRMLQLKAYAEFLFLDFTLVGLALVVVGFFSLWRLARTLFWFFLLAVLGLGPAFFFYASFPIMNRFSLGTYERFLLPSYTILAVVMGVGASTIIQFSLKRSHLFRLALIVILFCFPLTMLSMTLWRFWGLREDRTADQLGEDILATAPQQSIVFVSRDTPLFATQYVRYALRFRPDIRLIHANRLWSTDYPRVLGRVFPDLAIPAEPPEKFALALVRANRDREAIFSNITFPLDDGWFWVPEGLLYRLTAKTDLPSLKKLKETNDELWSRYRSPGSGILSRYRHLMLSDVLGVYAGARLVVGKIFLKGGAAAAAKEYFRAAIAFDSEMETQDAYTYLGLAELFDGSCDGALAAFAAARKASLAPDSILTFYEGITYRDCAKNEEKAKELLTRYEELRASQDISLQ